MQAIFLINFMAFLSVRTCTILFHLFQEKSANYFLFFFRICTW